MSFGVYIHWPFCKSKCPYCDFNSHVHNSINHEQWRDSYLKELSHWANLTRERMVTSVFFGGGTPSLMKPDVVADIIAAIQQKWRVCNDCEITLEANPTSIEIDKLRGFRDAGVNRVSVGVQSLREADLKFLGREHSPREALKAIDMAAKIFDRFSFDLIYARPQQTVTSWSEELREALNHAGKHLSLYQLTIEQGTPFYTRHARGEFIVPEQNHAADLYDVTQDIMGAAGLPAYEVSNHAAAGEESRHNLVYWRYDDYVGIGPGAHGRVTLHGKKYATRAHRAPEKWLELVGQNGHGAFPIEEISAESQFQERLMMGLRVSEGVEMTHLPGMFLSDKKLEKLVLEGFLVRGDTHLRTTPEGRKCLNAVLGYLLAG